MKELTQSPYFELAGWSLVYSIWQGLVLALIIFFILKATKGYLSSSWRYLIALTGQVAILLLTIYTFANEIPYRNIHAYDMGEAILLFTGKTGLDITSKINLVDNFRMYIQDFIPVFMGFWAFGFVLYLIRIFGGLAYLQRLRASSYTAGHDLVQIGKDLARQLGVYQSFHVVQSIHLKNPVVIGHFRPLIILPVGITSDLTLSEIKGILAHELAHIKRYDYLINIFQSFIEALYFFNPFVWWISAMVQEEREHACDDMAVACIENKRSYAEALLKIKERNPSGMLMLSPGIAGYKGSTLIERIKRITNNDMKSKPVDWLPALVLAAILIIPAFLLARETSRSENKELLVMASSGPELMIITPEEMANPLPEFSRLMLADTIPQKKKDKKKSNENLESDIDNEIEREEDRNNDFEYDVDPDLDFEFNIDPDMDFDFSFDYDFGEMPDMPDMPSMNLDLPPLPPFYMDGTDTFPNSWNQEDWKAMSEQWHKEMERFQQEMSRFKEEFNQNLNFNLQEWESTHRMEIEELQKQIQEEMGNVEMEELHEQQEKLMQEFNQGVWQEEFHEQMETIREQMQEFQQQIQSMPDMEHLKEMEQNLQNEMRHLKDFEREMKSQLESDGYISENEDARIEFWKDELLVNGKKVKDKDLPKYKKLRQKFFPEDDGNFNYKIN